MKRVFSVVAVAVLLGGNLVAKDVEPLKLTHKQMKSESIKSEANRQEKVFDKTSHEIAVAMHKTFSALKDLQYGKTKEAKTLLEEANKKFDEVLKKNPKLKLIPIDNVIEAYSFESSNKNIKLALDSAVTLLKHHKTQAVRDLLLPMKDELDITTLYIPMDVYPNFIKTSIKQLEQKDTKGAILTLIDCFNTIVGQKVVVPTPLLMAQDYVIAASKIDKSKKDEAKKLLDLAKNELEKAELLGYVDKDSKVYKNLQNSIQNIKNEIDGKNKVEKLYNKLKDSFKNFIDKFREDKEKVTKPSLNDAQKQVQEYEKKQMQKAIKEAKEFEEEAKKEASKK